MIEVLLDNIRSIYNVGAIFRTCDGIGINHIHICGITPTPDHPKIAKTSLGAETATTWTQHWNALELVEHKKKSGHQIWALEIAPGAESLLKIEPLEEGLPILLIIGNENTGIDHQILDFADKIISIPMVGIKESLNVSIAFGIAAFFLQHNTRINHAE
ncbi:MAG: TrmH family RNA methyltransferase [Anaerolineaceae bacterium]|nr:TrmH family RNA methyltransferase [Anaerolineaceae bacterium]